MKQIIHSLLLNDIVCTIYQKSEDILVPLFVGHSVLFYWLEKIPNSQIGLFWSFRHAAQNWTAKVGERVALNYFFLDGVYMFSPLPLAPDTPTSSKS